MRVMILGNGYVGSNLNKELVSSGKHDVRVYGRSDMDYHDKDKLNAALVEFDPWLVVGCFGFTGRPNIDEAEVKKKECWNLNVQVPLMVNTLCAERKSGYTHISTGCLFNGYEKVWSEDDEPNFGIFNDPSFYTKSKHAFELASAHLPNINLRIRLPFNEESTKRNLIWKLVGYDMILNYRNSKTSMSDLCSSIRIMAESGVLIEKTGVYHMSNPEPLTTEEFVAEMKSWGLSNPNWQYKNLDELALGAPRANICVTTNRSENPMMNCRTELEALRDSLAKMRKMGAI